MIKSTHGSYIAQEGHVLQPLASPAHPIGNVLTYYLSQAAISTSEPDVDIGTLRNMLSWSQSTFPEFMKRLSVGDSDPPSNESPEAKKKREDDRARLAATYGVVLASRLGSRELLETISLEVRAVLASLLLPHRTLTNYGFCRLKQISEVPGFSRVDTITIASGYKKPYIVPMNEFQDADNLFTYESPYADAIENWCHAFFYMDVHRYNFGLFVPKDTAKGIDLRDKQFAVSALWLAISEDFYAFFALYRLSAMVMEAAHHGRLAAYAKSDFTRRMGKRMADFVEEAIADDDEFATIPVHPFVSYMRNAYNSGTVATEIGVHPAIYYYGHKMQPTADPNCIQRNASIFGERFAQFVRSRAQSQIADACATGAWGKVTLPAGRRYSATEIMRALRAEVGLLDRMRAMANKLGWGSIQADVGMMDRLGRDFALTDGRKTNRSPDQIVLGFTPLLALQNRQARGASWQYIQAADTMAVKVYAVPYSGMTDVTPTREHLERRYLPASMTMGDTDVSLVNMLNIRAENDAVAASLIVYFQTKMQNYVTSDYLIEKQDRTPPLNYVKTTFWDPFGIGPNKLELDDEWNYVIKPSARPANEVMWATPRSGAQFYGRTNLQLSITSSVYLMNREGMVTIDSAPSGDIIIDTIEEPSLTHDFASMDKLMNALAPVAQHNPMTSVTSAELASATKEIA